jgi:hypothetical protein
MISFVLLLFFWTENWPDLNQTIPPDFFLDQPDFYFLPRHTVCSLDRAEFNLGNAVLGMKADRQHVRLAGG